ncbi:hypothetical protein CBS101457_002664 [Exobasidium rhododendri]|nr:hypothetical protein CBS101457_002664 [Exobasidium rhododendri]
MAIFGKKKDKHSGQQETVNDAGSPVIQEGGGEGFNSRSPPTNSGSREGHGPYQGTTSVSQLMQMQQQQQTGQPSFGSMTHGQKQSISGPGGAGVGSGFGPPNGMQPTSSAIRPPNGISQQRQQPMQLQGGNNAAPGSASGFKFGGGPSGPGQSGIPVPGSQMRGYNNNGMRKASLEPEQRFQGGTAAPMAGTAGNGVNSVNGMNSMNGPGIGPGINGMIPSQQSNNGISGLPASSSQGLPIQGGPGVGGEKPRSQQVVYPWSQRGLMMNPPRFLDESRQAPPGAFSPSPFPRYGHAANAFASANGEVYLFGGLVRESVKNDLYVVYVDKVNQVPTQVPPGAAPNSIALSGGVNATLVQTTGEIPPPRVGHATVLVANVLILWGGDTKVRADDKQDEGLYLLNLSTREWTRVRQNNENYNEGPVGRYGHTVAIVGSRFFVFGGQVDGTFMNDLWTFDLNSLKSTPTWNVLQPTSELPPKRTGHASVTYKEKIFIFGGTDGQYHYNDTWCYDVATNLWSELSCIGYIPVPREGHAACLVDDVMYIFGGRGVDGKDLGDLASFRITNQRWYMFANMGPSPSGRSGHALTTFQNKVIVLGGESFTGTKADDPALVHVLDTGKIKYPPEGGSKSPPPSTTAATTTGIGGGGRKINAPPTNDLANRAVSPTERSLSPSQRGGSGAGGNESLMGIMQRPPTLAESAQQQQPPQAPPSQPPMQMLDEAGPLGADRLNTTAAPEDEPNRAASPHDTSRSAAAPIKQRPLSKDAKGITPQQPSVLTQQQQQQKQSNTTPPPQQQPLQSQVQPQQPLAAPSSAFVPPPTQMIPQQQVARSMAMPPRSNASVPAYTGPKSQRSLENVRNGSISPPGSQYSRGMNGIGSVGTGSDERGMVASPPPQDGFHYGSSSQHQNGTLRGVQSTTSPVEVEMLRKREAWMKAALAMAVKKGFVMPEQPDFVNGISSTSGQTADSSLEDVDTGPEGSDKERIVRALISLKSQLSLAKSKIAQQAQGEADRIAEADRGRAAAVSEAAFYRAKMDALDRGNTSEVDRMQRSKIADIERQLSETLRDCSESERQVSRIKEELKLEQRLRSSAELRLNETSKRAMTSEASQMKAYDELTQLQKKSYQSESQLRDHKEKVLSLTTLAATYQSNHQVAQRQVEDLQDETGKHAAALQDLQAALATSAARSAEYEQLHYKNRDVVQQHESTISRLQSELSAKSAEADGHSNRAVELESLVALHREEANSHKQAVTNGLSRVLAYQQQRENSRSNTPSSAVPMHVQDRLQALQEESDSLRQLHAQSKQTADEAHSLLNETKEWNYSLERQQSGLKSELSAMRSQLSIALQEVARMKEQSNTKEYELRDVKRSMESTQVKHGLLKQFASDRGVLVPDDDELSSKNGYAERRIEELEEEVDLQSRELQETEHRLRDASSRVEELSRELEHSKIQSRSRGTYNSDDQADSQKRIEDVERELEETNASYRGRMSQLENDYQTAVQFVKGSEKMLRRMKDELTRYKTENTSLQSELINLRSGNYPPSSDNEAIRDIEALRTRLVDLTQENEAIGAENRDLDKKLLATISEQKDYHDKNRIINNDGARKTKELEIQINQLEGNLNNVRKELQETLTLNTHLSNELYSASRGTGAVSSHRSRLSMSNGTSPVNSNVAKDLSNAQMQNQQLKIEKENLAHRLQDSEDKLQLLLGRMEGNESEGNLGRHSHAFSISSELDKWERDRATDTFSAVAASGR